MNPNTPTPAARRPGRRWILLIVAAVLIAGVALFASLREYLSAGPFDAERMNAIVEVVRRQKIGEEQVIFHIDDLSRPEALYPLQQPLTARPNIWARRIDGALQVAIITRDRGHLGEYGFLFSEAPVVEVEKIRSQTLYNIPGPMEDLGKRIADHWWEAANLAR